MTGILRRSTDKAPRAFVIVGGGFVGVVTAGVLSAMGHRVTVVDSDPARVVALGGGEVPFHEPGLDALWSAAIGRGAAVYPAGSEEASRAMALAWATVVCVPTPRVGGGQDASAVIDVAERWARAQVDGGLGPEAWGFFVIRSTVLPDAIRKASHAISAVVIDALAPGLWSKWNAVVHVPEFLAEGTAVWDAWDPDRLVLGWLDRDAVPEPRRAALADAVNPNSAPTFHVTAETASVVKYASNTLLASRLTVLQEIALFAGEHGADIVEASRALGYDERIGGHFLNVGAGWGGSCFPKDVGSLADGAWRAGLVTPALDAVTQSNADVARQWVAGQLRDRLRDAAKSRTLLRVAWLGLTFKPGTSDTRCSASVAALEGVLASAFTLGAAVDVRAYDPKAPADAVTDTRVRRVSTFSEAVAQADIVVLGTGWPEYADALEDALDLAAPGVTVVDARNFWPDTCKADLPAGAEYVPFGRPKVCG